MSCVAVSPMASPRLALPAHRTSAPLASILRSSRTPMNSPRSPAARAIAANVTDYFSSANGGYEGSSRTPVTTPAAAGTFTALNSPRRGLNGAVGNPFDASALARTLNALQTNRTPVATSPLSFSVAGACLSGASAFGTAAPSSSLSARRRPSLRISDLPPLVMPAPTLDTLHLMARGISETSYEGSDAETVVDCAGFTPGATEVDAEDYLGLGHGLGLGVRMVDGKRIPTPYPERKAWLEDGEAEHYNA
ncbi:hypothetical protein JCM11641_004830 [Rhodosporidiobolus odoratus]